MYIYTYIYFLYMLCCSLMRLDMWVPKQSRPCVNGPCKIINTDAEYGSLSKARALGQ